MREFSNMRLLKSIVGGSSTRAPISDMGMLRAVAVGDVQAFEQLHRKYFPKLMHFSRRITDSAEVAEEVANDVLMTVWKTADRFEGRSKPSTWIFGIAYRMSLKQRQKLGMRKGDVELDDTLIGDDTDVAEQVAISEDLMKAMQQLKPELRAVVELTYYNGYLYTEIAEILDCPVGTVKTRMMTARKQLRGMLSDHDISGDRNEVA